MLQRRGLAGDLRQVAQAQAVGLQRVEARTTVDAAIGQVGHHEGVAAAAAGQRVGAAGPGDEVVAVVAGDDVSPGIAGGVDVGSAGERQVLEGGAQRPGDAGAHGVGAAAHRGFFQLVAAVVDPIGVVARTADHRVGAFLAVEHVVAGVPDDRVAQRIAGAVDGGAAGERQALDVVAERVGGARLHQVIALVHPFLHAVGGLVDHIGVVAGPADERVDALLAVEQVVALVAGDEVGQGVADARQRGLAGQHQALDVGREGVRAAAAHGVGAGIGVFGHAVASVFDDVGVVALAPGHDVGAQAAVDAVVADVAGDLVGQRIAGGIDVATALQAQHLDLHGVQDGPAGAGFDGVAARARARHFHHLVPGVVHLVGVVAHAADHRVDACAAIEGVVARVAGDPVGQGIARTRHVGGAGEHQVLHVRAQAVAERGAHRVVAGIDAFGHHVAVAVDRVGVVAQAAGHGVGAEAAVQHVVPVVAGEQVVQHVAGAVDVGAAGQLQPFHLRAELVSDGSLHRVGRALQRVFHHHVAHVVDDVGVVAGPPVQGVRAFQPVQHVVAGVAPEHVVHVAAGAVDAGQAGQREVFDVRAHLVPDAGDDQVASRVELLGHDVVDVVHHVGVVAQAAGHDVCARPAVQAVGGVVADDQVVAFVAGAVDSRRPQEFQVFHPGGQGQRIGDRASHEVGAFAGVFHHLHPRVADQVGVVAEASHERVGAAAAVEQVVAGVARDEVVLRVAGAAEVARALQFQVLHVGAQRVADAGAHGVGAFAVRLADQVARVVDGVGVAASSADQGVGTQSAVDAVGPGVADDEVARLIAGGGQVGSAGQREPLDGRTQAVAHRADDLVGAFAIDFDDHVAEVVHQVGVVARAAGQGVGPGTAIQDVVAGIAAQHVGHRIAGARQVFGAGEFQVLEVVRQRQRGIGAHRVVAAVGRFHDDVAGVVDDIGVVAQPAGQRVGPDTAVEHVVAIVAGDGVGGGVAGAADVGRAGERQHLETLAEAVAGVGDDRVAPAAGGGALHDDVAAVVHPVGVVAGAAGQGVGARAAIQHVGTGIAGDLVVEFVAGAGDVGAAGQHQVLEVAPQRVAQGRDHGVGTAVGVFSHHVAGVVDHVGVVAPAAGHRVGALAAVQHVPAGVAGQGVVQLVAGAVDAGGPGEQQVLQVVAQRVGDGRAHRVAALGGDFGHHVAHVVHHVGVVARAADQAVGTRAAVEAVAAAVAGDLVGQAVAGGVDVAGAREHDVLDVAGQREGGPRVDGVHAVAGRLLDHVGRVVDPVRVVAGPALQRVDVGTPVEHVGTAVADDQVARRVAGAVEVGLAQQFQVLQVGAQGEVHRGAHSVGAFGRLLDGLVAQVVHEVGVVARPALQRVGPRAAVDQVVADVAGDAVGQGIARAAGVRTAREHQVLDVGAQHVAQPGEHGVVAAAGQLGDDVSRVVHGVAVVAGAAGHRVGPEAAVQAVGCLVAGDPVGPFIAAAREVGAARQLQVLDVGAQRVAHRRTHEVGALARGFRDPVARVVDDVGVVARAASHRVGTGPAVDDVGPRVARDPVDPGVARAVQVVAPGQFQVLDVGGQQQADAGPHRVGAFAGRLDHLVGGVVHRIGVVAQAAGHGVGSRVAVDHVVALVAADAVGQGIAGGAQVGGARQLQVLQRGREGEVDRRAHEVRALAGVLEHDVGAAVHDIGVVARTTGHRVGTCPAVQQVVAVVAEQAVVQFVAQSLQVAAARQHQVFDVRAQREADGTAHGVDAFARVFQDRVRSVVHHVGVIARAARHRVRTRATVQQVAAGVAGQAVVQFVAGAAKVGAAGEHEVLDVRRQRVAHRAANRVAAFASVLDDLVARVVHPIGVVAIAAQQGVRAGSAVDGVGPGVAGDAVGQRIARAADGAAAREHQVVDVGRQRVTDRGEHEVGAGVGILQHGIAEVVHQVRVIPRAAGQRVGPRAAVQGVGALVAGDEVVRRVAGGAEVARADQREVLQVGAQRPAEAGAHGVDPFADAFEDLVADVVHRVGVVALAAPQGVGPRAAVQGVVAAVALQQVGRGVAGGVDVAAAGEGQVFDVGAQRMADAGAHQVAALPGDFAHHVPGVVDEVGVVARAARQGVCPQAAVERVGPVVAGDPVGQFIAAAAEVGAAGQLQVFDVRAQGVADR